MTGAKAYAVGRMTLGYGNSVNNQGLGGPFYWTALFLYFEAYCKVLVVLCPSFRLVPLEEICADMDLNDPRVMCCDCLPLVCPDCKEHGCSPDTGCCTSYWSPEWYAYCGMKPPKKPWDCDHIEAACKRIGSLYPDFEKCHDDLSDWSHYPGGNFLFYMACGDAIKKAKKNWKERGCMALMTIGKTSTLGVRPMKCRGLLSWCNALARDYCYGNRLCNRHYDECC